MNGFSSFNELSVFLDTHQEQLLELALGAKKHPSLARGNEASAISELSADHAFGGDIHGKLRSMVGSIGGLVDRAALPEEVQEAWDTLDATRREYLAQVKPLRKMIDAENQKPEHAEKPLGYSNLEKMEYVLESLDPTVAENFKTIHRLQHHYKVQYDRLTRALEACETVPLHLAIPAKNHAAAHDMRAFIPNEPAGEVSILTMLVADYLVKDGQLGKLSLPIELSSGGISAKTTQNVQLHFLETLENVPQAREFSAALDAKLRDDICGFIDNVLDKRHARRLRMESPGMYLDYSALRKTLGMHESCAETPLAQVETETVALETPHTQRGGDIRKCPYHRVINALGFGNR